MTRSRRVGAAADDGRTEHLPEAMAAARGLPLCVADLLRHSGLAANRRPAGRRPARSASSWAGVCHRGLADRINAWLAADPAPLGQSSAAKMTAADRNWSWRAVAKDVTSASGRGYPHPIAGACTKGSGIPAPLQYNPGRPMTPLRFWNHVGLTGLRVGCSLSCRCSSTVAVLGPTAVLIDLLLDVTISFSAPFRGILLRGVYAIIKRRVKPGDESGGSADSWQYEVEVDGVPGNHRRPPWPGTVGVLDEDATNHGQRLLAAVRLALSATVERQQVVRR